MPRYVPLLLVVVSIAFLSVGCATNKALNAELKRMARNPEPVPEYRIAPPDQLNIEVRGYPEFSRTETVRPDGKVTLPSVGDVRVQGLTVPEATNLIAEGLKTELAKPQVTVVVAAANSKAVYVLGEVRRPGLHAFFGDMTLVDAIAQSEGLSYYADSAKVTLTRESLDNPLVYKINLRQLINKGAAEQNMILKDGDIIYVPPTPLAKIGYAMDQLFFPFRSILSGIVTYGGVRSAFNQP